MKITVVVDNCVPISTPSPFLGEHGASLLIENNNKLILLDAGQSSAVVHNLSLLGRHPAELDAIVISHGHYDHTGGLYHLLKHRRKPISIFAHPRIFDARYSIAGGRYHIGIPYIKDELSSIGAEWQMFDKPIEIFSDLWFSGQIPRVTDYETGDRHLMTCFEGCDCQDNIDDDTSLFYKHEKGMVVIGGCTHSGLVNTVEYGFIITGKRNLYGWIGGTHLGPVSAEQQSKTLAFLEARKPEFLLANHCTGFHMMAKLYDKFGKRFIPAFVSTTFEC